VPCCRWFARQKTGGYRHVCRHFTPSRITMKS
jgi:hypothetical protein